MSFDLQMTTGGDAFDEPLAEVARILRGVADRLENGDTTGICRDINGNTAGRWTYDGGPEAELVTCDTCPATSEAGWGDTPLCLDCQRAADPTLVCELHDLTRNAGLPCPVCASELTDEAILLDAITAASRLVGEGQTRRIETPTATGELEAAITQAHRLGVSDAVVGGRIDKRLDPAKWLRSAALADVSECSWRTATDTESVDVAVELIEAVMRVRELGVDDQQIIACIDERLDPADWMERASAATAPESRPTAPESRPTAEVERLHPTATIHRSMYDLWVAVNELERRMAQGASVPWAEWRDRFAWRQADDLGDRLVFRSSTTLDGFEIVPPVGFSMIDSFCDEPYRLVWASRLDLVLLTFCEGDLSYEQANDSDGFRAAYMAAARFYAGLKG